MIGGTQVKTKRHSLCAVAIRNEKSQFTVSTVLSLSLSPTPLSIVSLDMNLSPCLSLSLSPSALPPVSGVYHRQKHESFSHPSSAIAAAASPAVSVLRSRKCSTSASRRRLCSEPSSVLRAYRNTSKRLRSCIPKVLCAGGDKHTRRCAWGGSLGRVRFGGRREIYDNAPL